MTLPNLVHRHQFQVEYGCADQSTMHFIRSLTVALKLIWLAGQTVMRAAPCLEEAIAASTTF